MYQWDEAKAASNKKKHGVAFSAVHGFEWETADIRHDDDAVGEERMVATGFIGMRVYVLVYVDRGETVRVISLRQATKKEIRRYEKG